MARVRRPGSTRNLYVPEHLQHLWLQVQAVAGAHDVSLSNLVALALRDFLAGHPRNCPVCHPVDLLETIDTDVRPLD